MGGGGNIGRACALSLAAEGYAIAVTDVNLETAQRTAEELTKSGKSVRIFTASCPWIGQRRPTPSCSGAKMSVKWSSPCSEREENSHMKLDSLFQHKIFSLFLALFTMALWGSLFPMVKLGYRAFQVDTAFVPDILLFAGLRFTVCGGLYVLLYSLSQHRFSAPPASAWPPVL